MADLPVGSAHRGVPLGAAAAASAAAAGASCVPGGLPASSASWPTASLPWPCHCQAAPHHTSACRHTVQRRSHMLGCTLHVSMQTQMPSQPEYTCQRQQAEPGMKLTPVPRHASRPRHKTDTQVWLPIVCTDSDIPAPCRVVL